jgi:hypothetical protein
MPDVKGDVRQGQRDRPKNLMVGCAQDTSKPAKLEKNKVPKFSHE